MEDGGTELAGIVEDLALEGIFHFFRASAFTKHSPNGRVVYLGALLQGGGILRE